jgi:hypothetical protein
MAVNDFVFYDVGAAGYPGDNVFSVQSQSTTIPYFNPGEMAFRALGAGAYVTSYAASLTTRPSVGTDYLAGITSGTSTEGASTNGTVTVTKFVPDVTFLITPASTSIYGVGSTPVQATYDALIGTRVLVTSSAQTNNVITYTLASADSQYNGLVVMPLDVTKYPGKVRVALRQALNFLA